MTYNLIDVNIGEKIKIRRRELGMSQTDLGKQIGVTFQQVQKYEKGSNKIVASKLFDLAKIMDVPIGYFFEGVNNNLPMQEDKVSDLCQLNEKQADFLYGNEEQQDLEEEKPARENITLIKLYNNLPTKSARKKLLLFLKALSIEKI